MITPTPLIPVELAGEQAQIWFAKQRMRPLSHEEMVQFERWLKADPANTRAWAQCERTWTLVEAVRDDPRMLVLREDARGRARERGARVRGWRIAGGMITGLALVAVAWMALKGSPISWNSGIPVVKERGASGPSTDLIREASTQVGERSYMVLADGSKVTLNTASAVRADYSGRDRHLTLLRGEAFFDVAKDATRPFIVTAGSRQVVAVGTEFNVRLDDRGVEVTLVEGKVRVLRSRSANTAVGAEDTGGRPVVLTAGSALLADADGADHIERLNADRATSWRNGKLIFEGERLADVVAEMNRYSRATIEIADPLLKDRKVSGVFEPTEGHAFTKALEAYGIAKATEESDTRIVLKRP